MVVHAVIYEEDVRRKMHKIRSHKPAVVESKFLPSLQGNHTKMSASNAIFLSDTEDEIRTKIRSAFSGGQDTLELQCELGANIDQDIPLKYLHTFGSIAYPEVGGPPFVRSPKLAKKLGEINFEQGDLGAIDAAYANGKIMSGEVKAMAAETCIEVVAQHKRARESVTEDMVQQFMTRRPLLRRECQRSTGMLYRYRLHDDCLDSAESFESVPRGACDRLH